MDQREITGPQTEIILSLHSLGISWHIKCTCTVENLVAQFFMITLLQIVCIQVISNKIYPPAWRNNDIHKISSSR